MSNTFNLSVSGSAVIGGATFNIGALISNLVVAGANAMHSIQNIATAATAIDLGSVGTPATLIIFNLDKTNYVEVDNVNTINAWPQKLLPADANGNPTSFLCLCPEAATVYLKAHTAACNVVVFAIPA